MEDYLVDELVVDLSKIGALKFGSFKLKSGIISPVYFDLRLLVSHPEIMIRIAKMIWNSKSNNALEFDVVCGVPYTALPIATVLSSIYKVPMILKRKEAKSYGTAQIIEGDHKPGIRCLIIEDVTTTGSSIVETAEVLRKYEIIVTDVIVILDRDQGARQNLKNHGINLHSLVHVKNLLSTLVSNKILTSKKVDEVNDFLSLHSSQFDYNPKLELKINKEILPKITNPSSKKLMELIWKKKTNLCLSADLEKWTDVLQAAELLGSQICCLKTHVDTLDFESYEQVLEFRRKLLDMSEKYGFVIMEDRKFADIGNTVHKQLTAKPFEISKWAHMVTVHGIPGNGILKCISAMANVGAVLIAEMSTEGTLSTKIPQYKTEIQNMVHGFEGIVAGFVSQSRVEQQDNKHYFIQFTPGVSLAPGTSDGLGQQYCSVEEAVFKRGADVIIVGRGILQKPREDWINTAEEFKVSAWNVWANRILLLKDGK